MNALQKVNQYIWDWKKERVEARVSVYLETGRGRKTIDDLVYELRHQIEEKIKQEIMYNIESKVDQEIINNLVKEISSQFDYKERVKEAFNRRLEDFLRGVSGGNRY